MCREELRSKPKTKTAEQALASLMRQCARAERASGDALRLMARWGVDPAARKGVLDKLLADKFIDDRRYAEAYIREKTNLSGWGARKIKASLRTKGVASSTIDELLSELDRDSLAERLLQKIERKASSIKGGTSYEVKGKLIRYGLSLGYDYEMVQDAISQIIKD